MKILALSDHVAQTVYSQDIRTNFGSVDLVVGCGDLPYYYLEFVVSMLDKPTLYVKGNHDGEVQHTSDGRRLTHAEGCELIDDRVVYAKGVLFMGLGGSIRYKPRAAQQFSEAEMRARVCRLLPALLLNRVRYGRYVDVLVTHSPPHRIHDWTDRAHVGFKVFRTLMTYLRPRYLLHGHTQTRRNVEQRETLFEATRVINVFPVLTLEITPGEIKQ